MSTDNVHYSALLRFRFHLEASLARIAAHAADVTAMTSQAVSEALLMTLYNACLPLIQSPTSVANVPAHLPSVDLLSKCSPWILSRFYPASVVGDGNCFFRSLSYSLYSTESYHVLLRLLCVLEVLFNRSFYDTAHDDFYAPYKADQWLVLPDYVTFVSTLTRVNSYCDMVAILAASSITQKAIQTLWPLPVNPGQLSPCTKLVIGRGVSSCCRPLPIMWTTTEYCDSNPHINHLVPLIERPTAPTDVIDCDQDSSFRSGLG